MNKSKTSNSSQKEQLLEKIVDDFTAKFRAGRKPKIERYEQKFPKLRTEIRELLSSIAMIEELKQQKESTVVSRRRRNSESFHLNRLGDYRIVRELGRGGMGIVLEAVHESLGRRVAIKVLPNQLVDDEKYVERFRREAQAAATLHHTNIVSVFGVGQCDGYHYYVMEYVDGCGLNQIIRSLDSQTKGHTKKTRRNQTIGMGETQLLHKAEEIDTETGSDGTDYELESHREFDEQWADQLGQSADRCRWAAEVILQISDALQYAHDQGKLHRDLKPANLLLDKKGYVWLTDFGLVKNLSSQTMTKTGDIIGTPQYMAPESFKGKYDSRSETYCLGLTLYEMVTLQPAFRDAPTPELIHQITTETPQAPRRIDTAVPRDLDTIIQKAIARDPAQRYATAAAMRDDLRAFLEDRPIRARRASTLERLHRWTKRNPWAAVSAMLVGLVAITASVGYLATSRALSDLSRQHIKLEQQKGQTDAALALAEENANKTRVQFERAESNVSLAMDMFDSMFAQIVFRGSANMHDFSFDGFQELSGIETALTQRDAEFLESMLVFYEKFAQQNADNMDLQLESARAFRRVANIYHVIGKLNQAQDSYNDALQLFTSLGIKLRESIPIAVDTAQTRNELGAAILQRGQYRQAMETFMRSWTELRSHPLHNDSEIQFELAKTLNLVGSATPVASPDTIDFYRYGLGRRRNFSGRRPRDPNPRRARKDAKESNQVLRDHSLVQKGIEILNGLIAGDDDRAEFRVERAKSYGRLAELYYSAKKTQAAAESKRLATHDMEPLVEQFPDNSMFISVLAQLYSLPTGENKSSEIRSLEKGRQLVNKLTEKSPHNLDYRQLEADITTKLSRIAIDENRFDDAIKHLTIAEKALATVVNETPRNRQLQIKRSWVAGELSKLLIKEKQFMNARSVLIPVITDLRPLARRDRVSPLVRRMLARHLQMLSRVFAELGDTQAARQADSEARSFRNQSNDRNNR